METLAALSLQIAWGADEALVEAPIDRVRIALPTKPPSTPLVPPAAAADMSRAAPTSRASACANAAETVEALRAALAGFNDCALAATATNLVFADGNPAAGLILVDDTPGPEEDMSGKPMTGPAGQLLDRMLASIGLDRSLLLITSLIPWRPPGGRPATGAEIAMCLPFLLRHLALLRPRIVVSLGAVPSQALSGNEATIRKLRGRWHTVTLPGATAPVKLLPMLHPATLLRTASAKKDAWSDLLTLQQALVKT